MIPRNVNGDVDTMSNVSKWTVAAVVGDYPGAVRYWWALDPRYDFENAMPDSYAQDRSKVFRYFENALNHALKMAQDDAE